MKLLTFLILIWMLALGCLAAGDMFDDFRKCRVGQTFDECVTHALNVILPQIKDGIKEYELEPLDPLKLPQFGFESSGNIQLRQVFDNTLIYNIGNQTTFTKVNADLVKNTVTVEFQNPVIIFVGNYKQSGKFLQIPVNDHGKFLVKFYNVFVRLIFTFDRRRENNNIYWHFTELKCFIKPNNITVKLDSLSEGKELYVSQFEKMLNENWPLVWDEKGPSFNKMMGEMLKGNLNKAFNKIAINQILQDEK